jgi:hypothetical protein
LAHAPRITSFHSFSRGDFKEAFSQLLRLCGEISRFSPWNTPIKLHVPRHPEGFGDVPRNPSKDPRSVSVF